MANIMDLYRGVEGGAMGTLWNQLQEAQRGMGANLAGRGMFQSPAAANAYQKSFQQNYMQQLMQVIPQLRLQAAQAQQQQANMAQQMAEKQRSARAREGLQQQGLMEQMRQFGITSSLQQRQQALAEKQLEEQLKALAEQNKNAWMGPTGQLLGNVLTMGLYPQAGMAGWLTNLFGGGGGVSGLNAGYGTPQPHQGNTFGNWGK